MRLLPAVLVVVAACTARPAPPQVAALPVAAPDACAPDSTTSRPRYPATRTENVIDELHGVAVADPYRWLEDNGSAEVVAWSHAEDDLARAWLAKLPETDVITQHFAGLMKTGEGRRDPVHVGSRTFYEARSSEADRWKAVYVDDSGGEPRMFLDSLAWRSDGTLSLGDWWSSPRGHWVAYQVKEDNLDRATLRVVNVETGAISPEEIEGAELPSVAWLPDESGFFYVRIPTTKELHAERFRHAEIRFHRVGHRPEDDRVVRKASPSAGDPRPQEYQLMTLSPDGRWLVAKVARPGAITQNDLYFEDLRSAKPQWRVLVEGESAHSWAKPFRDRFYVLTDEGAPNQHIFVVDPAHPEREAWREIVPTRPQSPLEDYQVVGGRLALTYSKDATSHTEIHDLDGRFVRDIPTPPLGVTFAPRGQADDDVAFYTFSSLIQPQTIMRTSIARGTTEVWAERRLGFEGSAYQVEQLFFASKDGTRVPMFIVRKKGAAKDGTAPTIITGYGGFGLTQWPEFNVFNVPWLEAGGTLVSVNLRGGFEYGETWHRDGMRQAKQHVFDDFISAAETLVREGYTSPAHLVASGFSNGGLLVAAVITQRPDLFAAAICDQPLTDMVRFAKYNAGAVAEYGDPSDAGDFAALLAYSPLQHVQAGTRYPPVLITASENDERAPPMHARKFAAALQTASSGGPVLLRVEWNVGHYGADSRMLYARQIAEEYAFALRFAR